MNVLLLGSGGRESALAWKIAQSTRLSQLFIAPGNPGTAAYGTNVAISPLDFDAILDFVDTNSINLIVVGPEAPLVNGITDFFASRRPDVLIVGPRKAGAALEGSKDFAKRFMTRHGIPTARFATFTADTIPQADAFLESLRPPYVLKADGLAAGKGVLIIDNLAEAKESLRRMLDGQFGKASATVVVEEFLSGIECSVFVLTDGQGRYRILPVAKDYKRIGEGDTGPNTGGMGAVSPVPFADNVFLEKVRNRIIKPTIQGLIDEGIDYRGFIFLGLIDVDSDPMVIEYNVRMGDPETEAVMLRIDSDLLQLISAAAAGNLGDIPLRESPLTSCTVMMVSQGYPGAYPKGLPIVGLDSAPTPGDSIVFHAGTALSPSGHILTAGGRVLTVSALASSIPQALEKSFRRIATISFPGAYFRRDIGIDLTKLKPIDNH